MATIAGMSAAQFDALPYEEGRRWELLDGELIAVSSSTPEHQDIVFRLLAAFKEYLKRCGSGRAHQDIEFALSERDRLRPDVCVLLGERAAIDARRIPVAGAPDIAVEVISPSERAGDSRRKVRTYLQAGVAEVWQVYPVTREVLVYAGAYRRECQAGESLSSPLLPGWSVAVADLFE